MMPRMELLDDTHAIRMKELDEAPANTAIMVYPGIILIKRHILHPVGLINENIND